MVRLSLALAAALLLAGCTQRTTASNTFKGTEKAVAQVVLDLSEDAQRGRQADVCGQILTDRLQQAVAGDSSCDSEVKKAFEDADVTQIEVDDVSISGNRATVDVHSDAGDKTVRRTFGLLRENGEWRIDSFDAGQSPITG
jgi:hypothetical protein